MKSISVQINDSPKLYFLLKDIYGEALALERADFDSLSYSVVKIQGGVEYPVDGFSKITTGLVWYPNAQEYPENIKGLTSAEKEEGYNLIVFPYDDVDGAWKSPFNEANATYNLIVELAYFMNDAALTGASLYERSYRVRITTGNN